LQAKRKKLMNKHLFTGGAVAVLAMLSAVSAVSVKANQPVAPAIAAAPKTETALGLVPQPEKVQMGAGEWELPMARRTPAGRRNFGPGNCST
jgi:hypothetical protein